MMLFSRRLIGNKYEALAKKYLVSRGLTFITENYNTKFGEIDLIMKDGSTFVFVEVKYRKDERYGNAAEFVNTKKINRIKRTANIWLKSNKHSPYMTDFRFDVIAIHREGKDINWIKNAITEG
ncbi:YraN family protein [Vibrio hannami]|uniref:YraN family protein n=1 Tax=Vibrio hannami TaxID=2717094 RepID=UPI00240ED5D3|nr:YraN family protein [Vibrio hannami]MDG3089071.1 YraN family protein [Vibrio hannami]